MDDGGSDRERSSWTVGDGVVVAAQADEMAFGGEEGREGG
jgi:hypothetical protein